MDKLYSISKTADILGIGRKTLHRKIEEWENAQ